MHPSIAQSPPIATVGPNPDVLTPPSATIRIHLLSGQSLAITTTPDGATLALHHQSSFLGAELAPLTAAERDDLIAALIRGRDLAEGHDYFTAPDGYGDPTVFEWDENGIDCGFVSSPASDWTWARVTAGIPTARLCPGGCKVALHGDDTTCVDHELTP